MELEQLVNPEETALLIVDVQNDYCDSAGSMAKQGLSIAAVEQMVPRLQNMVDQAHRYRVPVIFLRTIHERSTDSAPWINRIRGMDQPDICRKETWGCEFYRIFPKAEDVVVTKHRYSGFIHTKLDSVLHTLNTKTLLVSGVSTNVCVESTARDGFMLDYNVVLLSDCTAAFSEQAHQSALQNIGQFFGHVVAASDVIGSWRSMQRVI
ncbi:MAG: isochorismatase family cysteine hydrolase [Sporolactobacillus sp.]